MTELGWASVGVLELTALPSVDQEVWAPPVRAADALLFWGGDPLYLSHWIRASGLADLLPTLDDTVHVGTSAGAIAAARVFGETYTEPRSARGSPLTSKRLEFTTPQGDVSRTLLSGAPRPDLRDRRRDRRRRVRRCGRRGLGGSWQRFAPR